MPGDDYAIYAAGDDDVLAMVVVLRGADGRPDCRLRSNKLTKTALAELLRAIADVLTETDRANA